MVDVALVERIDALGPVEFEGEGYRHLGPQYPPRSGEGARISGGRWNPPDSFPVLYLGLDFPTIVAEFYRTAARHARPPEDLLPRRIYRYEIHLAAVLDLRGGAARDALGLSEQDLRGDDLRPCQAIGEAAHYMSLEGILAPSAAGPGSVLAAFDAKLRAGSRISDVESFEWTELPARP